MQESEKRKFIFIVGVVASGVVTLSCILTMILSSLQLFVLMPVETFDGLYGKQWKLANVGRFDFQRPDDFLAAERTLIARAKAAKDKDPAPYFMLGELYQSLSKNQDALPYYKKALTIASHDWYNRTVHQYLINNIQAELAMIYYEDNDPGKALDAVRQMRETALYPLSSYDWASDPFKTSTLMDFKHYSMLAQKQTRLNALRDVLENPKRADFRLALARCFSRELKLELARSEAEKALTLSQDPQVQLQVRHFLSSGLPRDIRAVTPLVRYYTLAADANEFMHIDLRSAANFYEQARRENPRLEWTYHHLGMVYRELKDYTRAMSNARKAAELNPGFYLSYLTMGDIELDRENYQAAIRHFNTARRILEGIPQQALEDINVPANIENQLGFSYELLNELEPAIRHYTAALELASSESDDYEYAHNALLRLKSPSKK